MEKEKISIIIPVYNVEKYLPTCLDSIIGQTYQNLEIIVVDDGSTDSSGQICDAYAQKDSRIKVIHQENCGAAVARNTGIACASGIYISFVDSDDWLSKSTYRILYKGLKKYDAQCSVGRCVHAIDNGKRIRYKKRKKYLIQCDDSKMAMKRVLLGGSAAWNRLYKRNLFDKIRFPEYKINEDEIAILRIYAECTRVVFLNQYTYYYRIRANSVTTSAFSLRNLDFYYNTLENVDFIKEKAPELLPCAEARVINALLYCYVKLRLKKGKSTEEKEKVKWLQKEVKRHKQMALTNPYCHAWMKLAMCILSVSYGGKTRV